MSHVEFRAVHKTWGHQVALQPFSLTLPKGSRTVLLGPSGCGKSTVLRLLAGLDQPSSGEIVVAGRRWESLPITERSCAMVFQNYALYPHMSVADNMTYALRVAGVGRAERAARARELADLLGLQSLLDRLPRQLSGGQRQRVAIGRALARPTEVLLFDEPLSNLDMQLRAELRLQLAQLHERLRSTWLYVTHDQTEAMTLADQIVVMHAGRIEQVGTPQDIYVRPATAFVASFVGVPGIGFVDAVREGCALRLGADSALTLQLNLDQGADALPAHWRLGIRPEQVRLAAAGLPARVRAVERHGREAVLLLDSVIGPLAAVGDSRLAEQRPGEPVRLDIDWPATHAFERDSGRRISGIRLTTAASAD